MSFFQNDQTILPPEASGKDESPKQTTKALSVSNVSSPGAFSTEYNPVIPEPEIPSNSLARLYHSFTKNDIEIKVYREQYLKIADKQAEMMMERANHIINKAKVIHENELRQLKEILSLHNADIISGLQQDAHEKIQQKLMDISTQYVKQIEKIAAFPSDIKEAMHQDAKAIWTHSREKVLKYALDLVGTQKASK